MAHPDDRSIITLAAPALGALAAEPLYSLVDTALVGHLGTAELGAAAVAGAAFTAFFWLFSFLAYGVTPKVARALSRGDEAGAAETGMQALILALSAGLVVAVVGWFISGAVTEVLGATGDVSRLGAPYLRIRFIGIPALLVIQVGHGWLRGAGRNATAMKVAVGGAVVNAGLAYLLIYPFELGLNGAAIATVISQAGAALAFLMILRRPLAGTARRVDPASMRSLLTVAGHLSVRTGTALAAITLSASLATRMGQVSLGAWQITNQLFLLFSLMLDAIAIAGQSLVAAAIGTQGPESEDAQGQLDEGAAVLDGPALDGPVLGGPALDGPVVDESAARRVSDRLLEWGLAGGMLLGALIFGLREPIATLFSDDPAVIAKTADLLAWLGVAQPLMALAFTFDGILIGAFETRYLAGAMALSSALYAGVSIFGYTQGWDVAALAAGATVWMLSRVITATARYRSPTWPRRPPP